MKHLLGSVLLALALFAGVQVAHARAEQSPPAVSSSALKAPVAFTSNGCSGFREKTFFTCCFVHDFAYWSGGSRKERSAADHELRRCINDIGRDYFRSYIAFVIMRLGLGSGVFVFDGWGRAWLGTDRGRFTALTPDERRIVAAERREVCQSLTLDPANGRYKIDTRFIRENEHHHLRPREARLLCGSESPIPR